MQEIVFLLIKIVDPSALVDTSKQELTGLGEK